MSDRKHVVIVGGGFGGISAAKKLKKADVDITLIDRHNHHLFQPLLYQVATAALSPGDIATPIRALLGRREGLQVRERILMSLEKAEQLNDPKLREPYLTYVIIGGGPTGVEMAGAIAEIAKRNMMRDYSTFSKNETRIFLVEAAPRILNGYPESLAEKARETLEDMGVRVLLDTPVTDIGAGKVSFSEGTIETPNIIWAAGVAASPMLSSLDTGQDRTGRVVVQDDLSLPDSDNIFVIGDAAHKKDEEGNPLPALAPVAMQQGDFIGKLIRNELKDKERPSFHFTDKGTMATIGRAKAVADIRGFKFSGFFAWILWSVVHIFFLIGFRNRFRVFVEWMWHYFTFKRGVRLITDRFTE